MSLYGNLGSWQQDSVVISYQSFIVYEYNKNNNKLLTAHPTQASKKLHVSNSSASLITRAMAGSCC